MIPAPFTYQRARTVEEALDLAAEAGDEGKYLAGGHSLLPLMKLRFAVPEVLIDIGRLTELSYVRDEDGHIAVRITARSGAAQDGHFLLGGLKSAREKLAGACKWPHAIAGPHN